MKSKISEPEKFFKPKSVAIVGVPRSAVRFGGGSFLDKLIECGFPGALYPINPRADEIQGLRAYPDLASLPEIPDLVIVCVAARFVPAVLEECARLGQRHIHILSSGFKEIDAEEGKLLEDRIAAIAREGRLLVVGPNCMGLYCPASRLTAWGAIPGKSGPVGVISQSGGITQRLTEYLFSLGLGVDKAVSVGNATVLDSADFLELMGEDDKIRVIAMYLESVKDGRRFLEVTKRVARTKPVIIFKGGDTDVGAKTVASHTGSLAGERRLWDAFFKQAGVVRARSMNEWVDAVMALSLLPAPGGNGVFLVGGGGGVSVAAADACVRDGLRVPALSDATMERMREVVPAAGSIAGNPLDAWRVFEDTQYLMEALQLGLDDPRVDMIVVDRLIPRAAFHSSEDGDPNPALIDFILRNAGGKPVVITADSDGGDPDLAAKGASLRARFCEAGIPAYASLDRAARALVHLHRYHSRFGAPPRTES